MTVPLHNYLRTYRKRAGLTQEDVAFLLGGEVGTTVGRHERSGREPSLETAIRYEAILGTAVRELFAGVYAEVETEVRARAEELLSRLQGSGHGLDSTRGETLAALAGLQEPLFIPVCEENEE